MAEMLHDSWHSRERPFLLEATRRLEENPRGPIWAHEVAEHLGMTNRQLDACLDRLRAASHIDVLNLDTFVEIRNVSPEIAREVGLWPSPELAADRLLAALDEAIETAKTPDERTRLEKFREGAAGVGTSLLVGLTNAMITGQLPQ